MTTTNEIELLKQHIRELSQEIASLKKMINPYMTSKEYNEVHSKFLNLSNIKAIAKNELANQLHYYKVTLRGRKNSTNGEVQEKVFRRKLITEIDCKPYPSKALDTSIDSHNELFNYLQRSYSSFFLDGKFSVQRVVQLK